jgi:uncharacterized protein (TIGR00266 family)
MRFEIRNRPSYALLEVELMPGESIEAEAGAMTYMTPNIRVNTKIREESFLSALGLKILGGQSFFVNEYTAFERSGRVALVSAPLGDMAHLKVSPGNGYIIQKSAYVASTPQVDLDIKWQGFTAAFSGKGFS